MTPHARKTASFILFLAALYNAAWGALGALWPAPMLELYGIADLNRVELWRCIAMLVGAYGAAYALAAGDPVAHWPVVLAGFLGKLLGAAGALVCVLGGVLPP